MRMAFEKAKGAVRDLPPMLDDVEFVRRIDTREYAELRAKSNQAKMDIGVCALIVRHCALHSRL
jgi:hypothetical protein